MLGLGVTGDKDHFGDPVGLWSLTSHHDSTWAGSLGGLEAGDSPLGSEQPHMWPVQKGTGEAACGADPALGSAPSPFHPQPSNLHLSSVSIPPISIPIPPPCLSLLHLPHQPHPSSISTPPQSPSRPPHWRTHRRTAMVESKGCKTSSPDAVSGRSGFPAPAQPCAPQAPAAGQQMGAKEEMACPVFLVRS